ncbi:caspase family protein [Almyronema epifaneia]|uniref:Caspase family protein n=1 Tax=Almyronema epifaneia S1 TaxID=2991925 RepID=A0ABW6I9W2_9CYAN
MQQFLKRRRFLQLTGATLTTLGMASLQQRYSQAQTTPRRLALLVGINRYPTTPLQGCVTDVQLQRSLLIHRFGFDPADIKVLTDEAATRTGILAAFETHLIQQARPGDVVVFHYSGHGAKVRDPQPLPNQPFNSTLVPIDSPDPIGGRSRGETVSDITGQTLFLLMQALATDQVTVVLDSCYSGGGKRGTLTVRSLPDSSEVPRPSDLELDYQNRWLAQLQISPEALAQQRQAGVAKGFVITSAGPNQLAVDANFGDFSAGAFTYLLTRYLWQQVGNEPVQQAIANIGRSTQSLAMEFSRIIQEPEFEANVTADKTNAPLYFVPHQTPPAEAVITQAQGNQVKIWLGGIDPRSLDAFGEATRFSALNARGEPLAQVKILTRQGLEAEGELLETRQIAHLQPGLLLQETVRAIPENIHLKIGVLTEYLAETRSLLAPLPRLEAVAADQPHDYFLGRLTTEGQALPEEALLPPVGAWGLFLPGRDLVPHSFGLADESLTAAIARLTPKFKLLLATHILKLLLNPNASRLNVVTALRRIDGGGEATASEVTVRSRGSAAVNPYRGILQIPIGAEIEFEVQNFEPRDLFISLLVITPAADLLLIYPNTWSAPTEAARVQAGEHLRIPEPGRDRFRLIVEAPVGMVEVLAIASAAPLRNALQVLSALGARRGLRDGEPAAADDALLDLADNLLLDFHTSAGRRGLGVTASDTVRQIDMRDLAAFSLMFEVVDETL